MNTVVLPTFRRFVVPRSLQAPWGPGMPGTHFVLRGDEYDVDIQDASPLTSGRAALVKRRRRKKRRQRGGAPPAPPPQRWQAAQRAYANRLPQRVSRRVNRGLWKIRRKLTPTTLTGKLAGAAALGGAAVAAPLALLGTLLGQLLRKQKV